MGLKDPEQKQDGGEGVRRVRLGVLYTEQLKREQCESLLLKQLPYLELRLYWARLSAVGCDGPCHKKVLSKIGEAQK